MVKWKQKNIVRLTKKGCKKARNRYISLSKKEKDKKREYGKNRFRNMSEEDKQKLKEYRNS